MKKTAYQTPVVDLICFSTEDVLEFSSTGGGDENAGEWDPQTVRIFN